jgi:membrane protein DedA with SNARE-associated domain
MLDIAGFTDPTPFAIFFALFAGTFISEDATCIIAGAAVAAGETSFLIAASACFAGIFVGDIVLFGVGRLLGPKVFQARFVGRLITDANRRRAQEWLDQNAAVAVFTSRFISGLRLPTYLAAGAVQVKAGKFTLWFFLAAVVWTPLLVGASAFSLDIVSPRYLAVGLVEAIVVVFSIRTFSSWTNRRLLIGKLRRIADWEFWPLAVFYAPVVCYLAWLALRHRSLTVFTAANPAIPSGGFVGESKNQIYELMSRSTAVRDHILRHILIRAPQQLPQRILTALAFIAKNKLTYPLVVKPDSGERGRGVEIIRNREELELAIKTANCDMIVQEFYGGVEASVFYYRFPGESRGHIFSITEKEFPFVVGDACSTVRELILRDKRAVCMARSYFRNLKEQLDRVPDAGESVQLIDIGTHSRGAIFREGAWLKTTELEDAIARISRSVDGFYFGRYDIRAESFDLLAAGEFKIIELNGVTSESTNIYDPRYNLIDAYKILFRQWRLAFAIGRANTVRGYRSLNISQFVRLLITRDASGLAEADGDKLRSTTTCA